MTHEYQEYYTIVTDWDLVPVSILWGLIRFDYRKKAGVAKVPSNLCIKCNKHKLAHDGK